MKINKTMKLLLQYVLVGGIATIAEWICFYMLFYILGINYLLSTAIAFVISTFVNWLTGKLIMFKNWDNIFQEILKIYLVSIVGLLLNLLLMWIMVAQLSFVEAFSKIIATGIVFTWNFIIRKVVIYKIVNE